MAENTDSAPRQRLRVDQPIAYEGLEEWPCYANDKMGRHQEIERLTPIITDSSGPFCHRD